MPSPDPAHEVEVYRRELAATPAGERERAAHLLYQLGLLYEGRGAAEDAAAAFARAAQLQPAFRPTLRAARRVDRGRGELAGVLRLLDAELRVAGSGPGRAALLRERAQLCEHRLDDPDAAARDYRAALVEEPGDLAAAGALERLALRAGDAGALREALRAQLGATGEPIERAVLLRDLAHVEAGPGGDPGVALEAVRAALELAPEHPALLDDLELLLAAQGAHAELAALLIRRGDATRRGAAAAARLSRAARLRRDRLGDGVGAAELLRRALERDPAQPLVAAELELLGRALGRRDDVVFALERRLHTTADRDEVAELLCRLAAERASAGDPTSALPLLQRAAALAPGGAGARALGRALAARDEQEEVAALFAAQAEVAVHPLDRADLLWRSGDVLERRLADPHGAADRYLSALAAAAGHAPSLDALERVLRQAGREEQLAAVYEREVARRGEGAAVLDLLEELAHLWADRAGDVERALDAYRLVLELEPGRLAALRALARLCASTGRFSELVELTEREAAATTDRRRAAHLLHRAGEVCEDRLLDLDRAAALYRRALDAVPDLLPALRALGRIVRQRGRWEELRAMHLAELALSSGEQALALRYAIADIERYEMLRDADATRTYQELLVHAPADLPALEELAEIHQDRGDAEGVAAVRAMQAEALPDGPDRALGLCRVAALREAAAPADRGALKAAAAAYATAHRLDPRLGSARAVAEQLLEDAGDDVRRADLLSRALERATEPAERAELAARLAALAEQGGGARRAMALSERAAAAAPGTPASAALSGEALSALRRTERLAAELGGDDVATRACDALARGLGDDPRAVAIYSLRAAAARELAPATLGDPAADYQRVLALLPGDAAARRGFERAVRQAGDPVRLGRLSRAQAAATRDPLERCALLLEAGEAREAEGDLAGAEEELRQALAACPDDLAVHAALARALEARGRWEERAALAESEAAALVEPDAAARALEQAARIHELRLGRPDRAVQALRRALERAPDRAEAFVALRRLLEAAGDAGQLAELLGRRAARTPDRSERAELRAALGRLAAGALGDPARAVKELEAALELEPYHPEALLALAEAHDQRGDVRGALGAYERALGVLADGERRRRVARRIAELLERLGPPARALEAWRLAATLRPDDDDALARLAFHARAAGDAEGALRALEGRRRLAGDARAGAALSREIAAIAEDPLEDLSRAVAALEEALALEPLDVDTVERLASLHGRRGDRASVERLLGDAATRLRDALAAEPLEPARYRGLARVFRRAKHVDGAYCAYAVLSALGAATETEEKFVRGYVRARRSTRALAPPRDRLEALVIPPGLRGPARELCRRLAPYLAEEHLRDVAPLGVKRGDRLRADAPATRAIEALAAPLALSDVELYVSQGAPGQVTAVPVEPPALVLGADLTALPLAPVARFRIARALLLLAEGGAGLEEVAGVELARRIEAIGDGRVLPRRLRKGLEPTLLHDAATHAPTWLPALLAGADRFGLLVCGEPEVALALVAGPSDLARAGRAPAFAALCRFAVSDEHLELRRELGMAREA